MADRGADEQKRRNGLGEFLSGKWHYFVTLVFGLVLTFGLWSVLNVGSLVLALLLLISGWTMCYAMTKIGQSKTLGALTAIIYMAAPYHLTDLYVCMDFGEVAALAVVPVLLLGLYQLSEQNKRAARKIAIALALLILTRSLAAVLFAGMSLIYVILNVRKIITWEGIWRMIVAATVGLGLSAFFWLPLIEQHMLGNGVDYWQVLQADGAETIVGNLQVVLTTVLLAILGLVGFWFAWKHIEDKSQRRFALSMYIISAIAMILMVLALDWQILPMRLPGAWRFVEIWTVAMSVVVGYVIYGLMQGATEWKQKIATVVAGVGIIYPVAGLFMGQVEGQLDIGGIVLWQAVQNMIDNGFTNLSQATQLGLLISGGMVILGVIWVMITMISDRKKRQKEQEVEKLMDSVREVIEEEVEEEKLKEVFAKEDVAAQEAVAEIAEKVKATEEKSATEPPKKKRGRPRKNTTNAKEEVSDVTKSKKTTGVAMATVKPKVKTTKIKASSSKKSQEEKIDESKTKTTRIKASSKKEVKK